MRRALIFVLAALFAGCAASRIESKRSSYIQSHNLDDQTERAIRSGRVLQGMPLDAVIASLGRYDRRNVQVAGRSAQVQLVYEVGQYRHAYVYFDESGRVTGYQNVCLLPYSCR